MAKLIVIVDKRETNRRLIAEDFKVLGCEVIEASDIEKLIVDYPKDPDMIIIREPTHIYEAVRKARSAYNAPIIAIGSDQGQRNGCIERGADGFYKMSEVFNGWAETLYQKCLNQKESDSYVGEARVRA